MVPRHRRWLQWGVVSATIEWGRKVLINPAGSCSDVPEMRCDLIGRHQPVRFGSVVLVGMAVVVVLAAGCGGGGGGRAAGRRVAVTVRNFRIDLPATVRAGTVTFVIDGAGPTMHEFNVARTNLAQDRLPQADDGTVDDKTPHPGFVHVAEREGIDIGQHKTLTVALTPGAYVLYCNMDGHYQAGMRAPIVVT
jgi:plastocyanin